MPLEVAIAACMSALSSNCNVLKGRCRFLSHLLDQGINLTYGAVRDWGVENEVLVVNSQYVLSWGSKPRTVQHASEYKGYGHDTC